MNSLQRTSYDRRLIVLIVLLLFVIFYFIYCCCFCTCTVDDSDFCPNPEDLTCVHQCLCEEGTMLECCGEEDRPEETDATYINGPFGMYLANRFLINARDTFELNDQKQALVNEINTMLASRTQLKPTKKPVKPKLPREKDANKDEKNDDGSIRQENGVDRPISNQVKKPLLKDTLLYVTVDDLEITRTCPYNPALYEFRFVLDRDIYLEVVKGQSGGGMGGRMAGMYEEELDIDATDLDIGMQSLNRPSIRRSAIPRSIDREEILKIAILDSGLKSEYKSNNAGFFLTGYNSVDDNTLTDDENGHGTAVTDILLDQIRRVFPADRQQRVKIIPVKILNRCGVGTLFDAACGLYYAAEAGASIVNLSVSTCDFDIGFAQAFYDVVTRDSLTVVAAAGNDSLNIMEKMSYPFAFQHFMPNVLGVTGLNMQLPDGASCDGQVNEFGLWKGYGAIGSPTVITTESTVNQANYTLLQANLAEASSGYHFPTRLADIPYDEMLFGQDTCKADLCYSGTSFSAPLLSAALANEWSKLSPGGSISVREMQDRVYTQAISPGHFKNFPNGVFEYTLASYWFGGVPPP